MDDEPEILWAGRPSHFSALGAYIIAGVVAVALIYFGVYLGLIGVAVLVAWTFLEIQTLKYVVTEEQIIIRWGILNRHVGYVELYRVKDFQVSAPLTLRPFGLGNLTMPTSDHDTPLVRFKAIREVEPTARLMRKVVERRRRERGVREIDTGAGW